MQTYYHVFLISAVLSQFGASVGARHGQIPIAIAHRGASAYAPEHTIAAYKLAIDQAADFVEQDIQVTRDGVLICLHDADLARTTNVEEIFPRRAGSPNPALKTEARTVWYAADFTLEEIKRLDSGSWFNRENPFAADEAFSRERVPTLQEAIEVIGSRAGLYIEMKHFEFYRTRGHDLAKKLAAVLDAAGFDAPDRRESVFIQAFSKAALLRLREVAPHYRRVQLLPMEDPGREEETKRVSPALATEISTYANGVGPNKNMIRDSRDVSVFAQAGLLVHPYTFRGPTTSVKRRPPDERLPDGVRVRDAIVAEIHRFIGYGINGGFTDYPDLWIEARKRSGK